MAWNVDDEVEVRFANGTFFPAVVKDISERDHGWYGVDLDDPLPTLADVGKTHPRMPDTTSMPRRVKVQAAACFMDNVNDHHIRDRA